MICLNWYRWLVLTGLSTYYKLLGLSEKWQNALGLEIWECNFSASEGCRVGYWIRTDRQKMTEIQCLGYEKWGWGRARRGDWVGEWWLKGAETHASAAPGAASATGLDVHTVGWLLRSVTGRSPGCNNHASITAKFRHSQSRLSGWQGTHCEHNKKMPSAQGGLRHWAKWMRQPNLRCLSKLAKAVCSKSRWTSTAKLPCENIFVCPIIYLVGHTKCWSMTNKISDLSHFCYYK